MLEYWIQNGETVIKEEITKDFIKNALTSIFQQDGKNTAFSRAYFSQLNKNASNIDFLTEFIVDSLQKQKESNNKTCSFCHKYGAFKLKGWIFPYIITKEKFPNIYSNGKVESLNICKKCAYKSILALNRVRFNAQKSGNVEYLSYIIFFSNTTDNLRRFYNVLQENIRPNYFRNITEYLVDQVYYPYEFLAALLYNIAIRLEDYEHYDLGSIIIGLTTGSKKIIGLTTGSKKIYETADIINYLNPVISAYRHLYNTNDKAFSMLFRRLREEGGNDPNLYIKRNIFFKTFLKFRSVDWAILEDILFYNISKNRTIPFINNFLHIIMNEFNMSEKELFKEVSNEGYKLGSELLRSEDNRRDRVKPILYELRRKRKLEEFLDAINLLQLKVEKQFYDKPFKDNPERFPRLKTFFLIGMANAIFQGKGEKNES
ncbi:MAG: hypothetical protein KatS3mg003_1748 [Candidatus Nitrosocaldaceae archaeon]|nr:MAG: hypothetical protein KatS3mg003_1748 [Candidatus Nitrosocaldaceae archaeon]